MSLAVVGAGAFGTALAVAMASNGTKVMLWGRDGAGVAAMARDRQNRRRLPDVHLPDPVHPTARIADLAAADVILLVVPAQRTAAFLADHSADLPAVPLVLCAKGVTVDGLRLQTDLCGPGPVAVLTGPGFADEIARGKPTALTLAAPAALATSLQGRLSRPALRIYRSEDMVGAQLGGALKNVVAIAAGVAVGAGLGESARAAIMTRGFAEMRRLAAAMGAEDATLAGLSGFGDLALTCASAKSRNFACGLALGQGRQTAGDTVEGIATAQAVVALARRHGVEMPVADAVTAVLDGRAALGDAISALLARPLREEE